MPTRCALAAGLLLATLFAPWKQTEVLGRVKLTTLPVRERVQIQLENPLATLVEEERLVTLLKGTNIVDFSWSNTRIEKSSIQLRVLDNPLRPAREDDADFVVRPDGTVETVQVINVSYPPGENALAWEVYSERPMAARVRISYVIEGLTRSFNYRATAAGDESTLTLAKYVRLDNRSGEDFGESGVWAGFGSRFQRDIGLNEAREMLLWRFTDVPVRKTYTFDWWNGRPVPDQPDQRYVSMKYVLENTTDSSMGLFPLQFGKVRIFQKYGHGGEAFIGEDWGRMTPIDGEMELALGLARDIVVSRRITANNRHTVHGNLFNQEVTIEYNVQNFTSDAVTLEIVEDIRRLRNTLCGVREHDPEWEVFGEAIPADRQIEMRDSRTLLIGVPLPGAPEEGEVEETVVKVRLWLRNEW